MISITEYLEMIFEDFKRHNEEEISLCQLKSLTFAGGYLPNYNNIQIQRLYLLRYAFAYGFEYSEIYLQALTMLNNPSKVSVVSIGCGTFIDYWSLVQTIERTKKINCKIEYVGIDEIDWNYKFDKRNIDEVYFEEYIQNGTNCEQDCISYLNRRPTMKTGNIYFQIIELERI